MNTLRTAIEVELISKEESHDCGSGDWHCTALLEDGTVLDPCEIFHDGHEPDYSTLRYMGGPTEEKLNYDPSLPLKCSS